MIEEMLIVKSRKDFLDMINDIISSTRKFMHINLEPKELIGDAKNIEEATRNSLFKLAEVMTLQFNVKSEWEMREIFWKYYKNIDAEKILKETKAFRNSNFPVQIPETKEEIIMKINELKKYCRNFYFLDKTHYVMNNFSTTVIVARMEIKEMEAKLNEL